MKFILAFIFFSVINPAVFFAQSADERIEKGIDFIYHLKFDSAEIVFNEVIKSEPGNPAGYFFIAMIDWWKINLNKENDSLDEKFFNEVEKVVETAEEKLDKNENDDIAMFYKGGALGYRGLVWSLRESWLKAAEDGREALNLLEHAYRINKENKDAIFGVGIYNYFAEYVPEKYPVVKPLMLIFPKGDKIKGLSQIKESSQEAKYAKTEALYVLAYLNLVYEKNFLESEHYSKILNEKFPENPVFEKYLYSSYVGLGKWNEAYEGWKKVLEKIDSGFTGYNNKNLAREANYYVALSLLRLNQIEEAKKFTAEAEEITKQIDPQNESSITAFIYLLSGMMNDITGNRSMAVYYYDKVLSMKDFQNSHQEAEKFKKEAYKQF